jgi:iron complex outermembrane receptor protein
MIPVAAYGSPDVPSSEGLQEIVVTATKRAENVQQIPIAVTAIEGQELAELGVQNAFDLAAYTPALRIDSDAGLAQPRFNLRGLGTDEYTPNANGSVGFYFDEVFYNSTLAQGLQLFDIDRVEVLRGPQGTLWGKNTTAGAVSLTSRAPTEQLDGHADVTFGNFGSRIVEAAVGGPVMDNVLLGRVSAIYNDFGGYVRNTYLGTIDNSHSEAAARAQLLWNLSDSGTLLFIAHAGNLNQVVPTFHAGYFPGGADANGIAYGNDRFQVAEDQRGLSYVTSDGGLAKLEWKFTNGLHLTNILAVENNNFQLLDDDDATPIVVANEGIFSSTRQVSEEFRLTSPDTGFISWIGGLYGLYEHLNSHYALPQFQVNTNSAIDTRNFAAFASATFHFTDKLTGRLGARYTQEEKSIEQTGETYTASPVDQFNVALSTTPPVPFLDFSPKRTWRRPTGDASLDYRITDHAMVYARIAKGFRGGNYNIAITGPNQEGAVNPETLIDYELGAKSQWLDNRLTLNGGVFRYDYRDLQVFLLQGNSGAVLQNAAKAKVDGVEFEASAAPTDQWLFRLSGSYIHARYASFADAAVPFPLNSGLPVDLTGRPLERAPKETADFLARYTLPVARGKLSFETDWQYTGKVIFAPWVGSNQLQPVPSLTPYLQSVFDLTTQNPVTMGNARASYTTEGGKLEIATWAKNITNAQYKTNYFNLFFNRSGGVYWNQPLTYGVTVSYKFGDGS